MHAHAGLPRAEGAGDHGLGLGPDDDGRRHVRRRRSRTDGRSYELVVTAAGVRAHRETHRLFEDVNARFLERLARPEGELRQVLAEVLAATGPPRRCRRGRRAAVVGDDPPGR